MEQSEVILEMNNISKTFPGVKALEDVNFSLRKGEVHTLIGENGAGKSTLMKILLGIYHADAGEIVYKGQPVKIEHPGTALNMGISMIHQELSLVRERTVAENIWIGREPRSKIGILNWKELFRKTEQLLAEFHLDFDPKQKVEKLSVAGRQMIEIARAISYNADVIIMDEPTSALTEKEVDTLFSIIRVLQSRGVAVVYISHKLDEIFEISDRVTVLRDGRYVGTRDIGEIDQPSLISMMVGREITAIFPKLEASIGDVVLEVKHLTRQGVFEDVSFQVRKGEILGFAGLMGAGRTEVVRGIFGIDPVDSGEIFINQEKVTIRSPRDAIEQGMGMVPEDRKLTGLVLCRSVNDNNSMAILNALSNWSFINKSAELVECHKMIELLSIKTPTHKQLVRSLSGGNQQKVVVAKWLSTKPKILILDEPTRGIDVGAKSEIHRLMSSFAQEGMAIIMISSEMPEVLGMSDRILVMHEGKIKGTLDREHATQEKIMACAVGHGDN